MNKCLPLLCTPFLVIFSRIILVNGPISVVVNTTMYEDKSTNILLDITNSFASGQFIHIIMSKEYHLNWFWGDFLKKDLFEKWSIAIMNPNKEVNGITVEHPDVFVIFFHNYQSLIKLCNSLHNSSESWHPGAKFLLITAMSTRHPIPAMDKFVINTFNYVWSRNVLRVSLVILNKSAKTAFLVSSSPYSELYKTCKKIVNISQLQEINLVYNETRLIKTKIAGYQFEPPNSFLGCPLVGHTFPFPPFSIADTSSPGGCKVYNSGIEVQLLKLLGSVHNFSLEILTAPSYGTGSEWLLEYSNGTRIGMLVDVIENKIDLAFAGVIPPSSFYSCLSLTNTYIDSSMSWYVPGAEMVPMWKLVLNTFTVATWLFMLSMLLLVTVLNYVMNNFERHDDEEQVDLTMVALSLGFSIQWTKRSRLRLMLLAWSLFSFHIVLMFNTRLFSVLTEHPFDSEIETVKDLSDSKLKTCMYSSYKKFYTNRTDGVVKSLVEKAHACDDLDLSVKILLKYKNFSLLAKDDYMAFKIVNKLKNIHRMKDNKFINYPVVMPLAKGSAFLGVLNKLVFNITESGLVFKWLNDARRTVIKSEHLLREMEDGDTPNYLMTREDFVWLYYLFFVGQAIAFIVFLIEIYLKSKRLNKVCRIV